MCFDAGDTADREPNPRTNGRSVSSADANRNARAKGNADPTHAYTDAGCVRDRDLLERAGDVGSEALSKGKHLGHRHLAQPDNRSLLWGGASDHSGEVSHDVGGR